MILFSRKHEEGETLEQYHAALTGLAAECEVGILEAQLVRDLFVTNVNVPELQRKFCIELTTPERVLKQAIAWERGVSSHKKLLKFTMDRGDPKLNVTGSDRLLNTMVDESEGLGSRTDSNEIKTEPIGAIKRQQQLPRNKVGRSIQCRNCGREYRPGHNLQCPAKGMQCRSCGRRDHSAKMCWSTGGSAWGSRRQNQQQIQTAGNTQSEPKRKRFIDQYQEEHGNGERDNQVGVIEDREERELSDALTMEEPEEYGMLGSQGTARYKVNLKVGSEFITFIVDTGSPTSFMDMKSAK